MLFNPETGKILGAQGVGEIGIDKRIDLIANSIKAGFTVYDLQDTEVCYAPPYNSAKDPVNIMGTAVRILWKIYLKIHNGMKLRTW